MTLNKKREILEKLHKDCKIEEQCYSTLLAELEERVEKHSLNQQQTIKNNLQVVIERFKLI